MSGTNIEKKTKNVWMPKSIMKTISNRNPFRFMGSSNVIWPENSSKAIEIF